MKNGENLTISNPRKIAIRMLNCANVDMVCRNSYSLTAVKRYQNRKLLAHNDFLKVKSEGERVNCSFLSASVNKKYSFAHKQILGTIFAYFDTEDLLKNCRSRVSADDAWPETRITVYLCRIFAVQYPADRACIPLLS
ncbi:hypothetical protein T4B_10443 [Trichinella pseudospiralis]|uniref:Uncharacterized protein n=1 Tax=Trichinella pseudospiralis TaxID=6337 RepID=A0A0V1IUL8_TRIPS|nr:hypothetical protein T4E_5781 [Trichinella pseudospiralis]KRY68392.1 hypothetical protein T4A_8078 [Trichinella pseudospiralis]KRZ26237.1 hypothetical protein T4B_10443 [Trichinella pseudospiralis]KRZ35403.1 hypothetical protein T4C_449 [Trichinella pseudospiralis]